MKIKNFNALLKCGFKEIKNDKNFKYGIASRYEMGGAFITHKNELDFDEDTPFDVQIQTIYLMTKYGCFDKPIKTLIELGWQLMGRVKNEVRYKKIINDTTFIIHIFENRYRYYYYEGTSSISAYTDLEELKAIVLEMEEMNNG